MNAMEFPVRNTPNQNQNCAVAVSGVDRTTSITTQLVALSRGHHGSEQAAIAYAARQCRVSVSVIRRFVYPSKRPKSVSLDIWERIRSGYLRFLRSQLAGLETEVLRVERLGADDGAARDLADKARTLVARIEAAARDIDAR
jgi:hypothetical protein